MVMTPGRWKRGRNSPDARRAMRRSLNALRRSSNGRRRIEDAAYFGHLARGESADLRVLLYRCFVVREVDAVSLVVDDERLDPLRLAIELRKCGVRRCRRRLELLAVQLPDTGDVAFDHIAFHGSLSLQEEPA